MTVAEGVEHLEDYLFLRNLDVDLVQGYYFAKPMTKTHLEDWLKSDIMTLRKQVKRLN